MRMVAQVFGGCWYVMRILLVIALIPVASIPAFVGIGIAMPILVVYGPIWWGIQQMRKHRKSKRHTTESRAQEQQPLLS